MFRLLVLSFLIASDASAQTFVESPIATLPGRIGLEAGVTVVADESVAVSGPEGLVLVGLVPGVEFRIGLPDLVGLDIRGAEVQAEPLRGIGDAALGLKVETGTLGGWQTAVLGEVSLPIGSKSVSSGAVSPFVLAVATREIAGVEVGVQVEGVWERAADRIDAGVLALVARSWSRWGVFGEAALASAEAGPDAVVHAGVLFALSPSVQLDARLGAGLTAAAPDAFAGVGIRAGL